MRPPAAPIRSDAPRGVAVAETGDGELVERTLAGERSAFDTLVRRYQKQAVAVAFRLLGNTQDALEVTQDAFLKSYSSLASLQKPGAFGGWLMRIVSNLSLNYRRGRKTRTQLALDDLMSSADGKGDGVNGGGQWPTTQADPLHQAQSAEMGKRLQEALGELPEKQRLAIILFAMEGWPQKDVAQALECSVEAVKWHVFQGRKKLKDLLAEHLT